jgi:hypothetical protein
MFCGPAKDRRRKSLHAARAGGARPQLVDVQCQSADPRGSSERLDREGNRGELPDWIAGTFGIRRMALIVRHPCATVASRLAQGWAPQSARIAVKQQAVRRRLPHLDALCRNLTDPFEVMAARWCLKNYVPLSLRPRPFHLIAYESLALHGAQDLVPMFAAWNLQLPPAIEQLRSRASATTKAGAMHGTAHRQPIDHWKKTLTREQIDRILRVVRDFGMDFYTEGPEPDYDRLNRPPSI